MADSKYHKVRTVNPTRKKKGGKKKGKKTMAKKRKKKSGGKKRRRRSNPTTKRRRSPRRRSNPVGLSINYKDAIMHSGVVARLLGKVCGAAMVRYWGDTEAEQASWTAGARWTMKNHLLNLLGGAIGGEIGARVMGKEFGTRMFVGAVDLSASKALWNELIAAIPGGPKYLGQANDAAALAQQAQEGDILDDNSGNRWVLQQGRWVPMMGYDTPDVGELVEASPLDGFGDLVEASPLDGYQQRKFQQRMALERQMGHATDATEAALYTRRGTDDPWLQQVYNA